MFDNIFNNDSIHTQPANDIERRVRAREEQRYMVVEDLGSTHPVPGNGRTLLSNVEHQVRQALSRRLANPSHFLLGSS